MFINLAEYLANRLVIFSLRNWQWLRVLSRGDHKGRVMKCRTKYRRNLADLVPNMIVLARLGY